MSRYDRKAFICTGRGKHNRTPTQAHTSRYSLHLRHVLESVGLHRRYALRRKNQAPSFRGAGACADERRTGVVAAEAATAKGHCPRLGLDRQEMLSRCFGLRQEKLTPDRKVLPKQGPAPNVGCRLKEINRTENTPILDAIHRVDEEY